LAHLDLANISSSTPFWTLGHRHPFEHQPIGPISTFNLYLNFSFLWNLNPYVKTIPPCIFWTSTIWPFSNFGHQPIFEKTIGLILKKVIRSIWKEAIGTLLKGPLGLFRKIPLDHFWITTQQRSPYHFWKELPNKGHSSSFENYQLTKAIEPILKNCLTKYIKLVLKNCLTKAIGTLQKINCQATFEDWTSSPFKVTPKNEIKGILRHFNTSWILRGKVPNFCLFRT